MSHCADAALVENQYKGSLMSAPNTANWIRTGLRRHGRDRR